MIYAFGSVPKEIAIGDIDKNVVSGGTVTLKELKAHNGKAFHFAPECLEECEKPDSSFHSVVEAYDTYLFCILSVRDISNVYYGQDRAALFIQKNLFLIVPLTDKDGSLTTVFEDAAKRVSAASVTIGRIIGMFFNRLCEKDNGRLEQLEVEIGEMETRVEKGATGKEFNKELLAMRRKLLIIHNYCEQLLDIADALVDNGPVLLGEKNQRHFVNLHNKITRLAGNTRQLRDNLRQVRETYQAVLDYNQNQIMKVFTIVTTVFLPLSLIVGWYGMNFVHMPELHWRYGYLGVIILSVLVVIGTFWFFKRKKLL